MKKTSDLFFVIPLIIVAVISIVLFVAGESVAARHTGGRMLSALIFIYVISAIKTGKVIVGSNGAENKKTNPGFFWTLIVIYSLVAALIFIFTFLPKP